MGHRLPEHIVNHINESIQAAELTNANFDGFSKKIKIVVYSYDDEDRVVETFEGSVTDFIREKVRLHHNSWVVGPLKRILKWSEGSDDGSMSEFDILGRLRSLWPNPSVLEEAHKEITELRAETSTQRAFIDKVKRAIGELLSE
jgi:hypothetical protein